MREMNNGIISVANGMASAKSVSKASVAKRKRTSAKAAIEKYGTGVSSGGVSVAQPGAG